MNVDGLTRSIIVCHETADGSPRGPASRARTEKDQAYHEACERRERKAAKEGCKAGASIKNWRRRTPNWPVRSIGPQGGTSDPGS